MTKYFCFVITVCFFPFSIFAQDLNIIGTWESPVADNHWQMNITWNQALNQYDGTLTKNGVLSERVGFSVGELVWTATPTSNVDQLKEEQKYRRGSNGISTGFEWKNGIVYLNQSTNSTLITSQSTFSRVNFQTTSGDCMANYSPAGQLHVPCVSVPDAFGGTTVYDIKLNQQSGSFTFDLDMGSVKPK